MRRRGVGCQWAGFGTFGTFAYRQDKVGAPEHRVKLKDLIPLRVDRALDDLSKKSGWWRPVNRDEQQGDHNGVIVENAMAAETVATAWRYGTKMMRDVVDQPLFSLGSPPARC